ncbi:MAG: GNAT family N-acetyltransferase [Clostridiales bacterium]|nr:MAG: GNAT family N-acetyltransferase [Clostridiales bacterium]
METFLPISIICRRIIELASPIYETRANYFDFSPLTMDFPIPALYNEEKTEEAHAMMKIQIRRYQEADTEPLTALIRQNLLAVNIRDYPAAEMEALANAYHTERLRQIAASTHFYVACVAGRPVGCGAVAPGWKPGTCWVQTVFVHPKHHGDGIGRRIMEALEQDPLAVEADRMELGASKTAHGFYLALGYTDLSGQPDQHGLYQMGKRLGGL